MSAVLLGNLLAYSLQVSALVATLALCERAGRRVSADAGLRLSLWQGSFAAACVLPLVAIALPSAATTRSALAFRAEMAGGRLDPSGLAGSVPWLDVAAVVLASGAAVRVAFLAMGYARIRRLRHDAVPILSTGVEVWPPELAGEASRMDVRIAADLAGPVCVGIRRPRVLVPPRFASLPVPVRRAVLCHELLHVRRRDPLRTLAIEAWCAGLWFHPAARLLVRRHDLAREMFLDREAIRLTGDRRAYAQALLAFGAAGAAPAGAAAFIHRDHLSQRVDALTRRDDPMSTSRRSRAVATVIALLLVATSTAAWLAPMPGAMSDRARGRQEPYRAGDGVEMPRVIRKVTPDHTAEAMQARIQGAVLLGVVAETDGTAGRIRVVRSLDPVHGLDAAAIEAVSQWRFEPGRKDGTPVPVEVEIEMMFTLRE